MVIGVIVNVLSFGARAFAYYRSIGLDTESGKAVDVSCRTRLIVRSLAVEGQWMFFFWYTHPSTRIGIIFMVGAFSFFRTTACCARARV